MKRNSASTQLLSLALFIVILAFFIVLNTISDYREDKVIPVLASLEAAFASQLISAKGLPSETENFEDVDLFAGSALDALDVSFRNAFDLISSKRIDGGRGLEIVLDKKTFQNAMEQANNTAFQSLMEKMFDISRENAFLMHVVGRAKNPYDAPADEVSSIGFYMMNAGFSPSFLTLSMEHGDPASLAFRFLRDKRLIVMPSQVSDDKKRDEKKPNEVPNEVKGGQE